MLLITSGCSFSECVSPASHISTWPRHLSTHLRCKHISSGLGCQGNGLISRKVIYDVDRMLRSHSADELLVGIMWSGISRHEVYVDLPDMKMENKDRWQINPSRFVNGSTGAWTIINHHWSMPTSQMYYQHFYNDHYGQILTLEHILRVQFYLQNKKIRYFMTTFMESVLIPELLAHPECKYLNEMIDTSAFLPIKGMSEWCRDNSEHAFGSDGIHPSTMQHKEFTDKVILPWLSDRYSVS